MGFMAMTEADGMDHERGQTERSPQVRMTTDPVVRTARLARRIRALGAELRDIPGAKRDLIIKMWSHGATPAEIARATVLPVARIERILDLNAAGPASSTKGGSSNGLAG